jgi:hypothetical protein
MPEPDSAYLWGCRTARITYVCHIGDLVAAVPGGISLIDMHALQAAAEEQAERYGAPVRFTDGYIDGALCTAWHHVGWETPLLLRYGDGTRRVVLDPPAWLDDWPREHTLTDRYRPQLPLGVPIA